MYCLTRDKIISLQYITYNVLKYICSTYFTQISTISGLIALCHSATESTESKLFPKLNDAQYTYASSAGNKEDLTTSASDRSKNSKILFRFVTLIIIIDILVVYCLRTKKRIILPWVND